MDLLLLFTNSINTYFNNKLFLIIMIFYFIMCINIDFNDKYKKDTIIMESLFIVILLFILDIPVTICLLIIYSIYMTIFHLLKKITANKIINLIATHFTPLFMVAYITLFIISIFI